MKKTKTGIVVTIICILAILVSPSWANLVDLTSSELGLSTGNYGQFLEIDGVMRISAISQITSSGWLTGSVYLDGNKGLGVQTLDGSSSKGISGGGEQEDEALIFDFFNDVSASSISIGLNNYKASKDDPVITLGLSDGQELVFTQTHQNWTNAVTSLGREKVMVDIGSLVEQNYGGAIVNTVSVMEPTGHIYVNAIGSAVPEPATLVFLGFGSLIFIRRNWA